MIAETSVTSVGVLVLDDAGCVIRMSSEAEALLGSAVFEGDRPLISDFLAQFPRVELHGTESGALFRSPDGRALQVEFTTNPTDDQGLQGQLAIVRDATELVEAYRAGEVQSRVTEVLLNTNSAANVVDRILESLGETFAWTCAEVWWLEDGALKRNERWQNRGRDWAGEVPRESVDAQAALRAEALKSRRAVCHRAAASIIPLKETTPSRWTVAFPVSADGIVRGIIQGSAERAPTNRRERLSLLEQLGERIGRQLERRTTEQRASGDLRLMQEIIDGTDAAIYAKDKRGAYLLLNKRAAELLDLDRDAVLGKTDFEVFPEEFAVRLTAVDRGVWEGDADVGLEEIVPHEDGPHVYYSLKYLLRDAVGVPYALAGISTDIQHIKDLENQLRSAQKLEAVGQLAAGVAHEINTPTQYVSDNTRFLKDAFDGMSGFCREAADVVAAAQHGSIPAGLLASAIAARDAADIEFLNDEIPNALQQSLEGLERVRTIVQAMKDFSHPGKEKTPVDLNRAIESTVVIARNEWRYVAELERDYDETLPSVTCTPSDINQVILNLIVNSAHAIAAQVGSGGEKGSITVGTRCLDRWVEIIVSDTGCGIPEDIQSRVFDPFFTTKEVGKGTGQGLSIAHQIVARQHGGSITFNSVPGRGTTFVVCLPLDEQQSSDGVSG